MTDEEKKLLQERFSKMFPKEAAQAQMPFYYHDKRKALIIKPHALYEGLQYAKKECISSIEIAGDNIDLSPFSNVDWIYTLGLSGNLENVDAIYNLPLTHLHIDNTENRAQVDLSKLTMLDRLSLTKNRKNIRGLSECVSISEICLYDYTTSKRNLSELSDLTNLRHIDLTYAKIDSLDGIEHLTNLRRLVVNYSRSLKSIEALAGSDVSQALAELEFDHCPNIITYRPIGSLTRIENIVIRECKSVDSKGFVDSLNKSVRVFISQGTKILDEI